MGLDFNRTFIKFVRNLLKTEMDKAKDDWQIFQCVLLEALKSESVSQMEKIIAKHGQIPTALLIASLDDCGISFMLTAIRNESYETFYFLLEMACHAGVDVHLHGTFEWDGIKYSNVSPLCAAIISRQSIIVDQFIIIEQGKLNKVRAGMQGIKSSSISREEKIEALELMGAAYVFYSKDSSTYAISIWEETARLRLSTSDGEPAIPKKISPHSHLFAKAMGFTLEFATLEELRQLKARLDFDNGHLEVNLFTQALLISQRILDQSDYEQRKYILTELCEYADEFYDAGQYNRVISIGMFMLDRFQGLEEWEAEFVNSVIIKTIEILNRSFFWLLELAGSDREEFTFANIMTTMEYTFEHNEQLQSVSHRGDDEYVVDWVIFEQVDILTEILPTLSGQESHRFKQCLYDFIRADYRFNIVGQGNLLHYACCSCEELFPINIMKLLLELGVNPNATSSNGMTALHVLASSRFARWSTNITDAVELLLNSGSHIDQPDHKGTTALDLFKLKERELAVKGISNVYLRNLVNRVRPLKRLAAQVVSQHKIPVDNQILPSSLLAIVNVH